MDDQERNGWNTTLAALRFRVGQHEAAAETASPDEAAFFRGMRDALTVARDAVEAHIATETGLDSTETPQTGENDADHVYGQQQPSAAKNGG